MDNRQNRDQYDQGYQSGWNQQDRRQNQGQDQPDYESDTFINRNPSPNPGYGEVYHGNVKQREEDTNRARGRNYNNTQQGRNQYDQQDYNQRSYGQGNYNQGGYGQVGYTGGGHGAWDSYGSGNQDMGRNEGYNSRNNMGNSGNYNRQGDWGGQDQRTGGNRYGGYGNDRRHDDGNNWWDRTKEKVSSWFSDDDNDDRRNYRNTGNQYGSGFDTENRGFGEHRGKGPRGYQRSDERIREDVCYRLYEDGRVDASDIDVNVEGSEVVLTGTVRSRDEKRRAEDLVEQIMGVRHVENRLRVQQDSGSWTNAGTGRNEQGRTGDYSRSSDSARTARTHDSSTYASTTGTSTTGNSSLENRSYTGNSGDGTGIGSESGTTNEIIRNSGSSDTK